MIRTVDSRTLKNMYRVTLIHWYAKQP